MRYTGQIEESFRHVNRTIDDPIVVQQPISAQIIPIRTARRDTAIDGFKLWWGVAEGAGKYGVLIVLPADETDPANGTVVSDFLALDETAGTEYEFTITAQSGGINDGLIPVLEAGETLVFAFSSADDEFTATTPSAIRNLMMTPAMREGVI